MSEFGESSRGVLNMIYRLSSKFEEFYYSVDRPKTPDGIKQGGAEDGEYECGFEEQPLDATWQHCRIFKAPILPEWRMSRDITIQKNVKYPIEMPDFIVWLGGIYVTDIVKEIIEEVDEFGHQFWPVSAFSCGKNKVNKEPLDKIYYRMNMRRYLHVKWNQKPVDKLDFTPSDAYLEAHTISSIQHNISIREKVETLPLWHHYGWTKREGWSFYNSSLFINDVLMNELKEAGVSGVMEYSKYEGTKQEMVGHV
ncbi:MAG: hypothetical protein H6998_04370 [Hahellaceae bacterium]|nr:hypothetical protein [Hahellaceae bacterium]